MTQLRDDFRQTRIIFRGQPLLYLGFPLVQTQHIVIGNLATIAVTGQTARSAVNLHAQRLDHIRMQNFGRLCVSSPGARAWIFCSSEPSAMAKPYSVLAQAL